MTIVQEVGQALGQVLSSAIAEPAYAIVSDSTLPKFQQNIVAAKPSLFMAAAALAEEVSARLLGLSEPEIALAVGLIQHIISNRHLVQAPSVTK